MCEIASSDKIRNCMLVKPLFIGHASNLGRACLSADSEILYLLCSYSCSYKYKTCNIICAVDHVLRFTSLFPTFAYHKLKAENREKAWKLN